MLLRIFTEPQQGATYDQQLEVARLAEELGFDAYFRSDHYLRIGEGDPGPGPTDAWVTLAGLARETSRIRLGTLVSPVTFRLPGPLAISVAQVDVMSGGRAELGLGTGWFDTEHAAYGIPFPPVPERFERLEEQLRILIGMWSTPPGGSFDFEGSHYELKESPSLPKPVQQPHPPIVMGGWGAKRTPRLAARYASEYNLPFGPASYAGEQFTRVRQACEHEGRDPATLVLSAAVTICCGSNRAEVERRAKVIGRPPDSVGVAGTPPEVVEQLGAFAEAGAERIYLQVLDLDDLDHIRLLGAEVLPAVAA